MDLEKLGLHGKSILRLLDLTDEQVVGLVELAEELKARKKSGANLKDALLYRKNIALIFQKSSTRTHCATVCCRAAPNRSMLSINELARLNMKSRLRLNSTAPW